VRLGLLLTIYAWVTNSVCTAIAWFQRDVTRGTATAHSQAYYVGRDNVYLDGYAIAKATLRATVHGAILTLVVLASPTRST
jgi:hypothetical protein